MEQMTGGRETGFKPQTTTAKPEGKMAA